MAPEGDGGGGGGAPPAPPAGGGDPKLLTEEDVGRMVNAAITSHLKRSQTETNKLITESIAGLKIDDKLSELVKQIKPVVEPDKDPSGKKGEMERQLQDLASKLELSEKRAQAAESARIEADNKRRFDNAMVEFRSMLQPKVRGELLNVAANNWALIEQRLKVAEDGSSTLRIKRSQYKGGPEQEEDIPLVEAVPILLASADAKPFLPAPSGGQQERPGAPNARPPRTPAAGNQNPSAADTSDAAKAQAVLDSLAAKNIDGGDIFG